MSIIDEAAPPELADLDAMLLAGQIRRATGAAFELAETRKDRGHDLSLSGLGDCSRVVAFRAAGVDPTDPELDGDKRQATLGTWLHRGFLPMLRLRLRGGRTEVPVSLAGSGLVLPGHVDLWWRRRGGDVVVDVKSVKEWGMGHIRTHGPRPVHLMQAQAYALALRQTKGADVRHVALIYVDRATGDHEPFVVPFGARQAAEVMERLADVGRWVGDPLAAPRDEDGPGMSWRCDHCPWLRACWGESARPGDVSVLGLDPDDRDAIEAALEEYDAARTARSAADARMRRARAALDRARPGRYGQMHLGWGRDTPPVLDKARAWDMLADVGVDLEDVAALHDLPLPLTGGRRGSIAVTRKGEE